MQSKEYSNRGRKKKRDERVHILFLYIRKLLLPPKIFIMSKNSEKVLIITYNLLVSCVSKASISD